MCTIEMIENLKIENSTNILGVCHFAVYITDDVFNIPPLTS